MRTALVALAASIVGVAVGAGVMAWEPWQDDGEGGGSSEHTIRGEMVLESGWVGEEPCTGGGGFSDISSGASIVVKDGADVTIATGWLEPGIRPKVTAAERRAGADIPTICSFAFVVDGVPTVDFYSIEVSHRGALTFTYDELEALDWTVAFKLGD
jgi:hypothetical protein